MMLRIFISIITVLVCYSELKTQEILIEGGSFMMGDPSETGEKYEQPSHKVTLNDFYMSVYEVKINDYLLFCKETQYNYPESITDDFPEGFPVFSVSWYDAVNYCNWLSKKNGLQSVYEIDGNVVYWNKKKNGFRLPTEAEWEYAARGGTMSKGYLYSGSNDPGEVGWHAMNSKLLLHQCGLKKPNELGLYDMSGNVLEWCWDWYSNDFYLNSPKKNPYGERDNSVLVQSMGKCIRGGNFISELKALTVFSRNAYFPGGSFGNIGFRIVRNATNK